LGVNNILGRVVWSQSSYLSAINDVLMFARDRTNVYDRDESYGSFIAQINSICNLLAAEDGPFLNSTRYSVNGEEILFLLHMSIVYLALIELDTSLLVNDPELLTKLEKSTDLLRDIILDPNAQGGQAIPLESLDYFDFNEGTFLTLIFKKGFPFWADGANSPHNFISSYISARLHAESGVTNTPISYLKVWYP